MNTLELIFLVAYLIVAGTLLVVLAAGSLLAILSISFEWFSDIFWNIKQTWKEYWK